MTDRELIDFLAEKVRGWHKDSKCHHDPSGDEWDEEWWIDNSGEYMMLVDDWNPLLNPNDCAGLKAEVRKHLCMYRIEWIGSRHEAQIWGPSRSESRNWREERMSLDVYLRGEYETRKCRCPNCWDEHDVKHAPTLYEANVTHNLGAMAAEAGIYKALWRPEEISITKAKQLIAPLTVGLALLQSDPLRFKAFNPPNGWGTYDDFVPWVEQYLKACIAHPEASVEVSR